VVFVATTGHILFANVAAEEMFSRRDGFESNAGKIRALVSASNDKLQNAIGEAAVMPGGAQNQNGITVERRSLLRAYQVTVFPVRSRFNQFLGMNAPSAVLLITDQEKEIRTSENMLAKLAGLTPSQAHVASLLMNGRSSAEIAEQLNIQENTVRAHLKSMFSKTGTRNQGELMRFLLTSCRH
jgi:DNA-binding CsgD family transcriptional regulator